MEWRITNTGVFQSMDYNLPSASRNVCCLFAQLLCQPCQPVVEQRLYSILHIGLSFPSRERSKSRHALESTHRTLSPLPQLRVPSSRLAKLRDTRTNIANNGYLWRYSQELISACGVASTKRHLDRRYIAHTLQSNCRRHTGSSYRSRNRVIAYAIRRSTFSGLMLTTCRVDITPSPAMVAVPSSGPASHTQ